MTKNIVHIALRYYRRQHSTVTDISFIKKKNGLLLHKKVKWIANSPPANILKHINFATYILKLCCLRYEVLKSFDEMPYPTVFGGTEILLYNT